MDNFNIIATSIVTAIAVLIIQTPITFLLRRQRVLSSLYRYCRRNGIGALSAGPDLRTEDAQLIELQSLGTVSPWLISTLVWLYK